MNPNDTRLQNVIHRLANKLEQQQQKCRDDGREASGGLAWIGVRQTANVAHALAKIHKPFLGSTSTCSTAISTSVKRILRWIASPAV